MTEHSPGADVATGLGSKPTAQMPDIGAKRRDRPFIYHERAQIIGDHNTTGLDLDVARAVEMILLREYPGWDWKVEAKCARHGVVFVRNGDLHPRWGYIVKLGEADTIKEWRRAIIAAGGELLERWHCPRGPKTPEAVASKVDSATVIADLLRDMQIRSRAAGGLR